MLEKYAPCVDEHEKIPHAIAMGNDDICPHGFRGMASPILKGDGRLRMLTEIALVPSTIATPDTFHDAKKGCGDGRVGAIPCGKKFVYIRSDIIST